MKRDWIRIGTGGSRSEITTLPTNDSLVSSKEKFFVTVASNSKKVTPVLRSRLCAKGTMVSRNFDAVGTFGRRLDRCLIVAPCVDIAKIPSTKRRRRRSSRGRLVNNRAFAVDIANRTSRSWRSDSRGRPRSHRNNRSEVERLTSLRKRADVAHVAPLNVELDQAI